MAAKVIRAKNEKKLLEVFDDFIEEKEVNGCVPKTIHDYRYSMQRFCSFFNFDENTACGEVAKQHVVKWTKYLKERVSPASVNHSLRNLRAFLYYMGVDYKISLVREEETIPKCYTDEELEKYLRKPKGEDSFTTWRTWA